MEKFKPIFAERTIFLLLLSSALSAIWVPVYLVQGDGPAHIYNSKILLDFISGNNSLFYEQYYDFVFAPVPNWFMHVCLAGLQFFFSPFIAEKIFLSLYVLLLPLSFRFLILQLYAGGSYGSLLIFPMLFHFLYFYGFYNYCFGIAFGLLFVGCWLKWRGQNILKQLARLAPLSALVFFTSPLGWFLIAVIISGFAIAEIVSLLTSGFSLNKTGNFLNAWLALGLSALLPLFFSIKFVYHHISEAQYYPETPARLWEAFFSLEKLNIYSEVEKSISQIFVFALCILVFSSTVLRIKSKTGFKKGDTLLVGTGLLLIIYFMQPLSLGIAGFWIARMSWLPWLLLIMWLCTVEQSSYMKIAMGITGSLVFLSLLIVRLPFQLKNSDAEEDYLSACKYIPAKSVVLPLSFCNAGCDKNGNVLNEKWFFQHAFDYSGAISPNINLVNYEAATPWFPVQWKQGHNPYLALGCAECQPPHVFLDGFEKNGSDWKIDYVITWCMKYHDSEHEWTRALQSQLEKDYLLIYESPSRRTQLWHKKPPEEKAVSTSF